MDALLWLRRLHPWKRTSSLHGQEYRVAFRLYDSEGTREVEVREFRNGEVYLLEREKAEDGSFVDRHSGKMVGPFDSPKKAELFIIATPWFRAPSETPSLPT